MPNHDQVDPVKTGKLAQQIVSILAVHDSPTRISAIRAAMVLFGEAGAALPNKNNNEMEEESDMESFFNRDENLKPSDYVQLCAAYHYKRFGMVSFRVNDLRDIANEAGFVIPDRLDMTLKQATNKGKKLFQAAGKGSFKPTTQAALMFREKWNVKPGKEAKKVGNSDE